MGRGEAGGRVSGEGGRVSGEGGGREGQWGGRGVGESECVWGRESVCEGERDSV